MNDLNPEPADSDRRALAGRWIRDAWYFALPSSALRAGAMTHRTILGQPVLFGRDSSGAVFALSDTCPHRGTLLSRGTFDGAAVECPYHGWRFATDGRCLAIPSQTPAQRPQPGDVRARTFPVTERQGIVWVFAGASAAPPVPEVPAIGDRPRLHLSMTFDCDLDLAVVGLMDPAHGAFVHRSALWRTKASIHEKSKSFSAVSVQGTIGWRMDRHAASRNSRAYALLLGGRPETEITYLMPSVRIEHATTGRFTYCGLTACTPVNAERTEVHHVMYWDVPFVAVLKPLIRAIARNFIDQDRRAVIAMRDGLTFNPPTMLVKDADTQARWYFRLKRELLDAAAEGRPPRNPIAPTTLTWRS
jgi:phenylpropionate dioxygenase-like ring-hydroxylating dioxygenase large terminal subunit